MINFEKLDSEELFKHGISFETAKETEVFAEIILAELECRVGEAISEGISSEQLLEFDMCNTSEESQAWLKQHCPNYKEIVRIKKAELEREIIQYRALIPGIVHLSSEECGKRPIEDLKLSARSYGCLRRAGLRTIGDVIAYGDLSTIRNMGRRCVEEVKTKLWEMLEQKTEPADLDNDELSAVFTSYSDYCEDDELLF